MVVLPRQVSPQERTSQARKFGYRRYFQSMSHVINEFPSALNVFVEILDEINGFVLESRLLKTFTHARSPQQIFYLVECVCKI